jgi:autotransporter strand-loop-strand O-heptosyltransferase
MNYYITHCDKNYVKYAERLFESLERFSDYKIIFITIDFYYDNKFDNVIPVYVNSEEYIRKEKFNIDIIDEKTKKAFFVFLKPLLLNEFLEGNLLRGLNEEDCFCYLDADCFSREECDNIFEYNKSSIENYPLLNLACQEYMMKGGRGCPFIDENHTMDYNLTLEAPLLKFLNISVNNRTTRYLQTGCILFNYKCKDFIQKWKNTCFSVVMSDWEYLAPFHEETVINCIFWDMGEIIHLDRVIINVPDDEVTFDEMLTKLKAPTDSLQRISQFCTIPEKEKMKNLHFFHGKCSDGEYNILMSRKKIYFKIHCSSLGDTLASTPSIRKIKQAYKNRINIVTHHKDLFKKNENVLNVYSFEEFDKLNINKKNCEIFHSFNTIGKKNDFGVEKKHNIIDIRQFHASDLGFSLLDHEMEYDYIADSYEEIENLPENYIALHVATTWPSRSYAKEKWQELIDLLNSKSIPVVLIGKKGFEAGFLNIHKETINLLVNMGLDLTNQLTISQCWHVINKAKFFVTMDSGLLHLAGTTDTHIIQLGSSINNKFRAPYRKGSQEYKYSYVSGQCGLFCASDMKYSVKEWGSIQNVAHLIGCLENKPDFECHPQPKQVFDVIENELVQEESGFEFSLDSVSDALGSINFSDVNKAKIKKILFLAPHLSTGGSPAYLKWLIEEKIKEGYKVKVIEYCYYGNYEVHRNQIKKIVGEENFHPFKTLHDSDEVYEENCKSLISFISDYAPDEIHLNEIAENFGLKLLTEELKDFLYNKHREFKIFETCHTSLFDFKNKVLMPDQFYFCSLYHFKVSSFLDTPKKLVDMKIDKKNRPERNKALDKLGLRKDCLHVLNVGLFTKDKNQKYLFDIAEKMVGKDVHFHFVGNTCFLNDCGLSEAQKSLVNCTIHGEKSNIDDYMAAMDLFVFPSLNELNPICIKEALSWGMKIFINNLDVYCGVFDQEPLITYIKDDNVLNYLDNNIDSFCTNELTHVIDFNEIKTYIEENDNSFSKSAFVKISGDQEFSYYVQFFDTSMKEIYSVEMKNNCWAAHELINGGVKIFVTNLTNKHVSKFEVDEPEDTFINQIDEEIRFQIPEEFQIKEPKDLELQNYTDCSIINQSGSLGDALAWLPIVNEYAQKNHKKIDYYTPHKNLFDKSRYPLISFFDYNDKKNIKSNINPIKIGVFDKTKISDPLQKHIAEMLGLKIDDFEKFKPILDTSYVKERPFEKKYVCIATHSTAQLKFWNNENGWRKTVNYLRFLGYEVVCIDKHNSYGNGDFMNQIPENSIHYPGESLGDIVNCLYHCEFMIGLSSGLSWLAWACNKPVVMICGFLKGEYHFYTPYYVQNNNVCHCCWNNAEHTFDASDWMWCPENKNFECSKQISFDMVKNKIKQLRRDCKK